MKFFLNHYVALCLLALSICTACVKKNQKSESFNHGETVKTRYELPPGYHRVVTDKGSFEEFLQNLPLKPEDYPTHLCDGSKKDRNVATSVIDLDIDPEDLQHGAAAIIRLRAEYLYQTGQFEKIHFTFTDGFQCDYTKWAQGFRIQSDGNGTRWYKADNDSEDYSYSTFREYLHTVFAHTDANTLATETRDAKEDEFGIGTIILDGRNPEKVAIVIDMLEKDSKRPNYMEDEMEVVLLAQGGNPAQEIEIIKGNGDEFGLFKEGDKDVTQRKHSFTWTTPNKGERRLSKQGGRLYTYDYDFIDKRIKKFNHNNNDK